MRTAIIEAIRAATFETTVCYLWNSNNNNNSNSNSNNSSSIHELQQPQEPNDGAFDSISDLVKMLAVVLVSTVLWLAAVVGESGLVEAFRSLRIPRRLFSTNFMRESAPPPSSAISTDSNSTSGSSRNSSNSFWEDLVPPFFNERGLDGFDFEDADFFNSSLSVFDDSSDEEDELYACSPPDVTHFCFLIHGHRGLSKDLRYMQTVMQRWTRVEKRRRSEQRLGKPSRRLRQDLIIHNAVCNEYKTTDGVRNGGDRLVTEMRQVIAAEMERRIVQAKQNLSASNIGETQQQDENIDDEIFDITLSVVGNSLGGLFARYAIAKLLEHCTEEENPKNEGHPCWILDGKYRLHFNVFCTTATPHLGVSGHTYLPLPRTAEIGVAHAMGDTGKDLFRLNDLIQTMATCSTYLGPLSRFRKRIAYANAYGTDFPVPASTAAFLSENSTYPHYFLEADTNNDDDTVVVNDNGLIIATLHTPNQFEVISGYDDLLNQHQHEDELHRMSTSLDRLGWKKVFVDMRREVPSVELPQVVMTRARRRRPVPSETETNESSSDGPMVLTNFHSLQQKRVVSSRDLASAVEVPADDNRLFLPLGHNMIVAFSRSRLSTTMNKAGRPVVEALAKELVEDIFNWRNQHKE